MITKKIGLNEYEVKVYDWIHKHDDYVCGYIKRDIGADDESDLKYWLFYPVGGKVPLNCGNMEGIARHLNKLNEDFA